MLFTHVSLEIVASTEFFVAKSTELGFCRPTVCSLHVASHVPLLGLLDRAQDSRVGYLSAQDGQDMRANMLPTSQVQLRLAAPCRWMYSLQVGRLVETETSVLACFSLQCQDAIIFAIRAPCLVQFGPGKIHFLKPDFVATAPSCVWGLIRTAVGQRWALGRAGRRICRDWNPCVERKRG